jgi:two-component system cell cycle response regulator CpdR
MAYRRIRAAIEAGEFPVDSALPTQPGLARELGVSTVTLRHALARLADEGYIEARQGSGTFVRSGRPRRGPVLVADDDPSIRDLLRTALEEFGYAVETVASGESAIDMVRRRHYSHVLLDVRMGEVDGVQAAERIAQLAPRTVVVFVTAYPTALLESPRGGTWPALVLRKPFDLGEVERVLELQRV